MSDTKVQISEFRFPCEPWIVDGAFGERMQPIPGTWTLAPEVLCRSGVKGILCCPNRDCKEAVLIPFDMGECIDGVLHLNELQCRKCGRFVHGRLLEWDNRKLFCAAYEILKGEPGKETEVIPRKEYMHAHSREEALAFFVSGTGYLLDQALQRWRLVDLAIALGYFGQEKDKDQVNLVV